MEVVLGLDLHYWWTLHKSCPYTFLIEGFIGSLSRLSPYCSPFCKYLIQFNPLHLPFPLQSTNLEVGKQFKLDRPIKSVQSEAVVQRCSAKKMFLEIVSWVTHDGETIGIEQKLPPEVFYKKGVLRKFAKFTGKPLCRSLFFSKVAGLKLATLLKKRLSHKCFPVNFANFLRTPFFIEHLWWQLLFNADGLPIMSYSGNNLQYFIDVLASHIL